MAHQMYLFASKSTGINPKTFATVLLLPTGDNGQPLQMDLAQAINKIPEHLRSGGYKVANAYSVLQTLCETKPRTIFNLVLKN